MPLALIDLEGATLTADERAVLANEPVAGVCLFARNTPDRHRARDLVADARAAAGRPLLVAIDQEGGGVVRLTDGAIPPAAMALGAIDDLATTEAVAAATARSLRAIGVDVDFAPVADVALDPRNPVIADRAFGSDPQAVARHVAAFVRGLQRAGVAATLKHFPGHGDVAVDSHLDLPRPGRRPRAARGRRVGTVPRRDRGGRRGRDDRPPAGARARPRAAGHHGAERDGGAADRAGLRRCGLQRRAEHARDRRPLDRTRGGGPRGGGGGGRAPAVRAARGARRGARGARGRRTRRSPRSCRPGRVPGAAGPPLGGLSGRSRGVRRRRRPRADGGRRPARGRRLRHPAAARARRAAGGGRRRRGPRQRRDRHHRAAHGGPRRRVAPAGHHPHWLADADGAALRAALADADALLVVTTSRVPLAPDAVAAGRAAFAGAAERGVPAVHVALWNPAHVASLPGPALASFGFRPDAVAAVVHALGTGEAPGRSPIPLAPWSAA
jgi:beta-N-acetylhexosaminidase